MSDREEEEDNNNNNNNMDLEEEDAVPFAAAGAAAARRSRRDHRRDRGGQQRGRGAGAGAGGAQNDNEEGDDDDNNNDGNGGGDGIFDVLVRRLREMAGGDTAMIDENEVRVALEAAEGNADLAATFYWDHVLAMQQQQQQQQQEEEEHHQEEEEPAPEPEEQQQDNDIDSDDDDDDGGVQGRMVVGDEVEPPRNRAAIVVRRSLDRDFARHSNNNRRNQQQQDDEHPEEEGDDGVVQQLHQQGEGGDNGDGVRLEAAAEVIAADAGGDAAPRREQGRRPAAPAQAAAAQDNNNVIDEHEQVRAMAERAAEAFLAANGGATGRGRRPGRNNNEEAAAAAAAGVANNPNQRENESVSVSDDESGGVWRRAAAKLSALEQAAEKKNGQLPSSSSRKRKRRDGAADDDSGEGKKGEDKKKVLDIDESGYLSETDWLYEVLNPTRSSIPLTPPTDLLWGNIPPPPPPPRPPPGVKGSDSGGGALSREAAAAAAAAAPDEGQAAGKQADAVAVAAAAAAAGSNVIAMDEDDRGGEEHQDPEETAPQKSGIPRPWLNAGFSLSECATGLVVKPPNDNDLTYYAWQQQASALASTTNTNRRNVPPPPYHCRALSALLSVVTAMLYTGTGTGSNSGLTFGQLDKHQRKLQFESRLADALSKLLEIAVQASVRRKRRALRDLKASKDPDKKFKAKQLEKKLELCPTCSWHVDPNTGEILVPNEGDYHTIGDLKVVTSYTNVNDLRSHVQSNIKSFTANGGCALFLENLVRIHGPGAIKRMMKHARCCGGLDDDLQGKKSCDKGSYHPHKCLIECTCEKEHEKKVETTKRWPKSSNPKMDTTPLRHDCMSIELVSLLITGKVHSTLQGWETGGRLGFGILSDKPGEVGKGLTRPSKPVWVLIGPTMYSNLWLKQTYDNPETFSREDHPGSVANLTHWNCWYSHRNATDLRIVQELRQWKAPKPLAVAAKASAATDGNNVHDLRKNRTLAQLKQRREADRLLRERLGGTETVDSDTVFTEEAMKRVVVHPDDQKYYPGKYHMWRYDLMGRCDDAASENTAGGGSERKRHAQTWTPFYRLDRREKLLVETMLGPKIRTILLTRWPWATIDVAEPNPVV